MILSLLPLLQTSVRAATPQSDQARRGLLQLLHNSRCCLTAECYCEAGESLSVRLEDVFIIQVQVWPCVPIWSDPDLTLQKSDKKDESCEEFSCQTASLLSPQSFIVAETLLSHITPDTFHTYILHLAAAILLNLHSCPFQGKPPPLTNETS